MDLTDTKIYVEDDVVHIIANGKHGEFPIVDLAYFMKPVNLSAEEISFFAALNIQWLVPILFMAQQREEYDLLSEFNFFDRLIGVFINEPFLDYIATVRNFSIVIFDLQVETDYRMKIYPESNIVTQESQIIATA